MLVRPDSPRPAAKPLQLRSRSYSSARTILHKINDVVSPHCGIIRNITYARFEPLFRDVHLYGCYLEQATPYAVRRFDELRRADPRRWLSRAFQGRAGHSASLDRYRALAGSIGEAVERYSQILFYDPAECITAPWKELEGVAIDPREYQLYSADEYARHPGYQPFRPESPMRWSWATDLHTGRSVLVPTQFCWLAYNCLPGEPYLKQGTSNGWAAHGTIEEALVKCIAENMERDSYIIMFFNKLQMPLVDLDTITHPESRRILDIIQRTGGVVHVISTMTEANYPTFVGIGLSRDPAFPPVVVSLGASLDPEIGVLRCLDELLQCYIYGTHMRRRGEATATQENVVSMMDHASYYMDPLRTREIEWMWSSPHRISLGDLPKRHLGNDPREDVARAVGVLAEAGIRLFALDTTPCDVDAAGFKTAKVLSPDIVQLEFGGGLVGKHCRRLFESPVRMGYLKKPLTPTQLNTQVQPHT